MPIMVAVALIFMSVYAITGFIVGGGIGALIGAITGGTMIFLLLFVFNRITK